MHIENTLDIPQYDSMHPFKGKKGNKNLMYKGI